MDKTSDVRDRLVSVYRDIYYYAHTKVLRLRGSGQMFEYREWIIDPESGRFVRYSWEDEKK